MSKRKNSDDLKYLKEKLKKLEREIYSSRRKRVRVMRIASSSSSSPSPEPSPSRRPVRQSEPKGTSNIYVKYFSVGYQSKCIMIVVSWAVLGAASITTRGSPLIMSFLS